MSRTSWGARRGAGRPCIRIPGRRGRRSVGLLLLVLTVTVVGAHAQAAALSVVEQTVTWSDASADVNVELALSDAAGVAGVDFTLAYPADRFLGLPSPQDGTLGFLIVPNTTQTGAVSVACARATGIATGGTLLTLTFSAPCAGNAQDHPDGNPVTLSISGLHLYDENGDELPATAQGGQIVLRCTATPTADVSFSALKAVYGSGPSVD